MKKPKKERMDFNNLYELYKEEDKTAGRILLYENMDRFLNTSGITLDIGMQYGYDDVKQDMFLKIEEWIVNSIDKGYVAKQAYGYIRCKVRNTMLNSINPTRGHNKVKYESDYGNDVLEEAVCTNIGMSAEDSAIYSIISDEIMQLDDLKKKIMILKFSNEEYNLQQISNMLGVNIHKVVCEYGEALNTIKKNVMYMVDIDSDVLLA